MRVYGCIVQHALTMPPDLGRLGLLGLGLLRLGLQRKQLSAPRVKFVFEHILKCLDGPVENVDCFIDKK